MIEKKLSTLYDQWANEKVGKIVPISPSGSNRKYYRITGVKNAIGVFNDDIKENIAFLNFTKLFLKKGLNVPEIYADNLKENVYLLQDLGDETLFSRIQNVRNGKEFDTELVTLYKQSLDELIKFQIVAGQEIDYEYCYPRAYFDKQSVLWDLNYFKYYFLRVMKIPFDEQELENDFQTLSHFLTNNVQFDHFMYRDFQSRNIMLCNDKLYFIDYQGGRRGALQYDLASLLYQARANVPENIREDLLKYYIHALSKVITVKEKEFIELYRGYVLIRMLQVLGAYGFRGIIEKKDHFMKSIPFAINNLKMFMESYQLPVKIPELMIVLKKIVLLR